MAAHQGSFLMKTLQPPPPVSAAAAITTPLLLLFSHSFGALEMPQSSLFFLLTIKTTKWKYKIQVSLAERGTREQDPPRESTERAEWQEGVEKHTRQFRNLYSIFPTQWKPKLHSWHSIFFWLTHHVKLINTNLSPPADRIGEMERQVTRCTTISEPCRGSHCLLVLFAGVALYYISEAL